MLQFVSAYLFNLIFYIVSPEAIEVSLSSIIKICINHLIISLKHFGLGVYMK